MSDHYAIESLIDENAALQAQLDPLTAEVARLKAANEQWHQRMSFVKTDIDALTAENERLDGELKHAEFEVNSLCGQKAAIQLQVTALEQQLAAMTQERDEAVHKFDLFVKLGYVAELKPSKEAL